MGPYCYPYGILLPILQWNIQLLKTQTVYIIDMLTLLINETANFFLAQFKY